MYGSCAFCDAPFGANEAVELLPVGRRLAFDAAKGRLWVVCAACARWSLAPIEERWEAVEECERRFRGTRLRYSTANVGLARLASGVELIRIGRPLRPELAAWRYSDHFGRRRRRALFTGGVLRHLYDARRVVCRVHAGHGDEVLVRGRHLREARILVGGPWGRSWGLMVSYGRGCLVKTGIEALDVAGVLLATINGSGAPLPDVSLAVEILERHGNAARCFQYAAERPEHERHRLSRLPVQIRLALEMAAHEETEQRALDGELARVEEAWREAEEIAAIADDLLVPEEVERWLAEQRQRRGMGAVNGGSRDCGSRDCGSRL